MLCTKDIQVYMELKFIECRKPVQKKWVDMDATCNRRCTTGICSNYLLNMEEVSLKDWKNDATSVKTAH